jgi:ribosomal protein S18 acetylase RimI-like enzyme
MRIKITSLQIPDEVDEVRQLFQEYEDFLGVDLCFQSFQEELASLPGKYGPPDGVLLIAIDGQNSVGCVALRKLEEGICEMKRLFVRPKYRGQGLGRRLAKQIIDEAVKLGYSSMRLDTLDKLIEAIRLYESLGFKRRDPYYHNPLSGVLYWELELERQKMG